MVTTVSAKFIRSRRSKKTRSSGSGPTSALSTLLAARDSILEKFGHSKSTLVTYRRYLIAGCKWIKAVCADRRRDNSDAEDGINTDLFEQAFTKPNKLTSHALELYILQKCVTEHKGRSTAEGIQASFADYFSRLGYGGPVYYRYNEATGAVGCPARADCVTRIVKAIRKRGRAEGRRRHAEAFDIEAMRKVIRWSERQFPSAKLEQLPKDRQELALMLRHAEGRAMFSVAFNVWLRVHELGELRVRHVKRGCINDKGHRYTRLHVEIRKGNGGGDPKDGPLRSNVYNIYSQPDVPEIDLLVQLDDWMDALELHRGRPLEPDDYLFPYISSNGAVHCDRPMSQKGVQNRIDEFCEGAGLEKYYSTHCFRRGGAQYRFMFARIRWCLKPSGGGAAGQKENRYLFDCLSSYEDSYADMLCPSALPELPPEPPPEPEQNPMSRNAAIAVVAELQPLLAELKPLVAELKQAQAGFSQFSAAHMVPNIYPPPPSFVHSNAAASGSGLPGPTTIPHAFNPNEMATPPHVNSSYHNPGGHPLNFVPSAYPPHVNFSYHNPGGHPLNFVPSAYPPHVNFSYHNPGGHPLNFVPYAYPPVGYYYPPTPMMAALIIHRIYPRTTATPASSNAIATTPPTQNNMGSGTPSSQPLVANKRVLNQIPRITPIELPSHTDPQAALSLETSVARKALLQWNVADDTGLSLSQWRTEWFTGDTSLKDAFAVKWGRRKTIAEEHQKCGGTDQQFLAAWPEAKDLTFNDLVAKIRKKNGAVARASKNGTPRSRRTLRR
ncbi:hypothetical protein FPV67DRAFT_1452067 [Lyophyllum atratum]|nr:hypothetical protein FPV67DRAFT_1452067 [Lyophyllum atratum]